MVGGTWCKNSFPCVKGGLNLSDIAADDELAASDPHRTASNFHLAASESTTAATTQEVEIRVQLTIAKDTILL